MVSSLFIEDIGEILQCRIMLPVGFQNGIGSFFVDRFVIGNIPIQIVGQEPGVLLVSHGIEDDSLYYLEFPVLQHQIMGGVVSSAAGTFVDNIPHIILFHILQNITITGTALGKHHGLTVCQCPDFKEIGRASCRERVSLCV